MHEGISLKNVTFVIKQNVTVTSASTSGRIKARRYPFSSAAQGQAVQRRSRSRTYLVGDEALVADGDGGLDALGELGVDAARVGEARAHRVGPRRRLVMKFQMWALEMVPDEALSLQLEYLAVILSHNSLEK